MPEAQTPGGQVGFVGQGGCPWGGGGGWISLLSHLVLPTSHTGLAQSHPLGPFPLRSENPPDSFDKRLELRQVG